jgi:integrase
MSIYKRGKKYWYHFVFNGRHYQESTKQSDKQAARQIEAARMTQLGKAEVGLKDLPKPECLKVSTLLDRLWETYKGTRKANSENLSQLKRTKEEFGSKIADTLSKEDVDAYVKRAQKDGFANSTINNLTGMLATAYRVAKLAPPEIRKLEVNNVRTGFFSRAEFDAVLAQLDGDWKDFVRFAYLTGWRFGMISALRWQDVDLEASEINLDGQYTKNGEPIKVTIEGEIAAVLAIRKKARTVKNAGSTGISAFMFHREGKPVCEFRKAWIRACLATGQGTMVCPKCQTEGTATRCAKCKSRAKYRGRHFHDFRRSVVRDLIRSGVPQSVAMDMTGHKTDSVFRRYNITDTQDLREAQRKMARYREEQQQKVATISANR